MDYWRQVREALLDFAWRDKYTRWYLILTPAWWITLWTVVPRLVDVTQHEWWTLAVLPLGWFGQHVIGKVCTEQRTGGAA